MYVTDKAEIVIDASSEDIWEYVTDPVHWTASNPEEHYGLEYDTPDNRPREGATFHVPPKKRLRMYADLHGRFQYIDHQVAVWAGTAYYRSAPSRTRHRSDSRRRDHSTRRD